MDKNFFVTFILLFCQYNIIKTLNNEIILFENEIGEVGNYTYELWKDYGETKMIIGENGKFSCSWENIGNVLFRIGKRWNCTYSYQEIGKIKVRFEFDYISNSNSTTRFAVYGWAKPPLKLYTDS